MTEAENAQELLRRAQGGERDAQNELIRIARVQIGKEVRIGFRSELGPVRRLSSPSDFIQDVFCNLSKKGIPWCKFKAYQDFLAYLRKAAKNSKLGAVRRAKATKRNPSREISLSARSSSSRKALNPPDKSSNRPSRIAAKEEQQAQDKQRLRDALKLLAERKGPDKAAAVIAYCQEKEAKAWAKELGISEGAARMRMQRAVCSLKEILSELWLNNDGSP
jgi:RNA polymerase sigma factor (sigma-70 family)